MLSIALLQALRVFLRVRPLAVLGMGGFAAGPGGLIAWLLRRPLLIHEQNSVPGLTNRLLAPCARVVLEGFPGSLPASPRTVAVGNPVRAPIAALAARVRIPISVDTTKAAVARRALEAGAAMINDISALRFDPDLAGVAAEFGVPVILMHMRGEPRSMQVAPHYDEPVTDIRGFLREAAALAEGRGIPRERLIVDPGIGFGKTPEHNLQLIKRLQEFADLDLPILVGPSRKSFIRRLVKPDGAKDIPASLPVVETGTQAAVAAAVLNGAHIVRVHDVANTAATVKVVDAIMNS